MIKDCPRKDLKPGMVIAEDVYSKTGQIIIPKDSTLTEPLILRLRFYNITSAPILFPDEPEPVPEPQPAPAPPKGNVQEPTYSQKVVRSKEFQTFQIDYSRVIATVKQEFGNSSAFKIEPIKIIEKSAEIFQSLCNDFSTINFIFTSNWGLQRDHRILCEYIFCNFRFSRVFSKSCPQSPAATGCYPPSF